VTISAQLSGIGAQRPLGGFVPTGMYFKIHFRKPQGLKAKRKNKKALRLQGFLLVRQY
jgi:hypothetical protein